MSNDRRTLATAYDPARNNLNLFRLILALLVVASHSYPITLGLERGEACEPLKVLTHGRTDLGSLAVDAFFSISGFLLAGSWLNSRSGVFGFVRRRVLRIYPGFFACVIVCIAVVGPLSVPNVPAYLADPRTYRLLHYLHFGRFWNSLPEAFARNPMPGIIDSSLWTIKYEVYCYVSIVALGSTQLFRGPVLAAIAVACLSLFAGLVLTGRTLPFALDPFYMPRLLTFFLVGTVAYFYREIIPIRGWLFAAATIVVVFTVRIAVWHPVILPIAGLYCLLYLACVRGPFTSFGRVHDLSYGTYLYAWPIQQLTLYYGWGQASPWKLTAVAVPVTFSFAAVSWFAIERPALRFKRSLRPIPAEKFQ